MTPVPSAAMRAKELRQRRKAALAPDLARILAEGEAARAALQQQAKDVTAVAHVLATSSMWLARIKATHSVAVRTRLLGELADWLSGEERQALFYRVRAAALPKKRIRKNRRLVPGWVPEDLNDAYRVRACAVGEIEAAREFRALKHGSAPCQR